MSRHLRIVVLLLLLGAALRCWDVGRVPPGLYHDEAQHGLDALQVLESHHVPLYFPANNGREPLYIWLVTVAVAVLGRTPLAVRFPACLVGMLTLAAFYDLARVLWGRRAGRWALAVLAVTFWHVHLSRVGFRAVLLPLFTSLWMAQAVRGLRRNSRRHWLAAGALYGASWYSYIAARFTPLALLMLGGYVWWTSTPDQRRKLVPSVGWFVLAALIVLLPLGGYTLLHPAVVLQRTGQVSVFDTAINGGDLWGTVWRHTRRTAAMFVLRGDRIWRHNLAWRPVWGPALGLAFVLGVGLALASWRRDLGAAIALLWTAVMALPTLLAEDAPHFLRAVGVLPTAALLPTLGLLWLRDRLPGAWRRIPLLLLGIGLGLTGYDYFAVYARAPQTYQWLEGGAVALAGKINEQRGAGWDGSRMLSGPPADRAIYLDQKLWESWTAIPFLVPREAVQFLPVSRVTWPPGGAAFFVWPYRAWADEILPLLPHPVYLQASPGPQAQGDKDPQPYTVADVVLAEPLPPVPPEIATFDNGMQLRAALVHPVSAGVQVQLYWRADNSPQADYTVFVHYLREGEKIAQHDGQPARDLLPTSLWQPGDLILDVHNLPQIHPRAGDTLWLGLYRSDNGASVSPAGIGVPVILVP